MSFSDDEDPFDDDEEFLELTRRPPKQSTQAFIQTQMLIQHKQQTQVESLPKTLPIGKLPSPPLFHDTQSIPTQQKKSQSLPVPTQNDLVFQASGQVALLKAKNEQLEREKNQLSVKLQRDFDAKAKEQAILVKKLQDTVRKLEDDKKFQMAEIRDYRMKIKRRRVAEEGKGKDVEMTDAISATTPPPSKNPNNQSDNVSQPQQPQQAQKLPQQPVPVVKQENVTIIKEVIQMKAPAPKSIESNTLFIDNITNYCIPGLDTPVMTILSNIAISEEEFKFEKFTSVAAEPLGLSLFNYLSEYKKSERLEIFIANFLKILMEIAKYLLKDVQIIKEFTEQRSELKHNRHKLLAIPFLLALTHCSLTYRPKAVVDLRLITTLLDFCMSLVAKLEYLLKPVEIDNEFYSRGMKLKLRSIQYEFLESFILIYSIDVLEVLFVNNVQSAEKTRSIMKEYCTKNKKRLLSLFKLVFANFSSSSVNLMLSTVNILNSTLNLWELEQNQEYPLITNDLLKTFVDVISSEFPPHKNWLVYGLNRSIGNNLDVVLINEVVPKKINLPLQLNPVYAKNHNEFQVSHNHHVHHIELNLQILQFIEKLVLFNYQNNHSNTLRFLAKEAAIFKGLVLNMSKIQQFNFLHPRQPSNINLKKTEILSLSLKVIHLVKELYILTPSESEENPDNSDFNFSSDLSFELFIILSRISFPSRQDTTDPSIDFLLQYQEKFPQLTRYYLTKLPGTWNMATVNLANPEEYQSIAQALCNTPNGLEIAYDSETVELAREILNNLVTPDEADLFYSAMKLADVDLSENVGHGI